MLPRPLRPLEFNGLQISAITESLLPTAHRYMGTGQDDPR